MSSVYVVPTRAGGFALMVVVCMLVASINYQLNLGYFLAFILFSTFLMSYVECCKNIGKLEIRVQQGSPQPVGEWCEISVRVKRCDARDRFGLCVRVFDASRQEVDRGLIDLTGASAVLKLKARMNVRGFNPSPLIRIQSVFPFGFAVSWCYVLSSSDFLAYPKAEHQPPPLVSKSEEGAGQGAANSIAVDMGSELREYRRGDAFKQIAWRRSSALMSAGILNLVSRDMSSMTPMRDIILTSDSVKNLPRELAISRLVAWVEQCEQRGDRYGLDVWGQVVPFNGGVEHRHRCLRTLALC